MLSRGRGAGLEGWPGHSPKHTGGTHSLQEQAIQGLVRRARIEYTALE